MLQQSERNVQPPGPHTQTDSKLTASFGLDALQLTWEEHKTIKHLTLNNLWPLMSHRSSSRVWRIVSTKRSAPCTFLFVCFIILSNALKKLVWINVSLRQMLTKRVFSLCPTRSEWSGLITLKPSLLSAWLTPVYSCREWKHLLCTWTRQSFLTGNLCTPWVLLIMKSKPQHRDTNIWYFQIIIILSKKFKIWSHFFPPSFRISLNVDLKNKFHWKKKLLS